MAKSELLCKDQRSHIHRVNTAKVTSRPNLNVNSGTAIYSFFFFLHCFVLCVCTVISTRGTALKSTKTCFVGGAGIWKCDFVSSVHFVAKEKKNTRLLLHDLSCNTELSNVLMESDYQKTLTRLRIKYKLMVNLRTCFMLSERSLCYFY